MSKPLKRSAVQSYEVFHRKVRGDVMLQDVLFAPETIKQGLDYLSSLGAGTAAYDPEMVHTFEDIVARRFGDYNADVHIMPHHGPEDAAVRAFYGITAYQAPPPMLTIEQDAQRIIKAAAREAMSQLPGIVAMNERYDRMAWMRAPLWATVRHADVDSAVFEARTRDWVAGADNPIRTNDKHNTIELYGGDAGDGYHDDVFGSAHPGWLVDRF